MDIQDTTKLYKSDNRLLSDSNYYKYIFKKTEKIVCAVFYVLEHTDKSRDGIVAVSVLESAKQSLDSVLLTLSCPWYTAYNELHAFLNTLVVLESHMHVAQAVALVQEDIADMLSLEIESVLRSLQHYLAYEKRSAPDLSSFNGVTRDTTNAQRTSPHVTGVERPIAGPTGSQGQSKGQRSERRRIIKDILASNRQSTIKYIAEKIPNLSEKTLQREINSMINETIIIKEGERRWTRYSLVPGV